ncbi:hypothetical protein GCK32_013045, partial [Trichostrongylus colubriformis]
VDVQKIPVIQGVHWQRESSSIPEKFQVVSTVFCLEYSCETLDGYQQAVRGACSLIEDGGYLENGMATSCAEGYKFITHDDIFLLISKKLR